MRTTSFIAMSVAAVNAASPPNTDITAIGELFTTNIMASSDFWRYFYLALQEDTQDDTSECLTGFDEFSALLTETVTLTADQTDYQAGLNTKGNGTATDAGFYMYAALKWADVGTQFSDMWVGCQTADFMTAIDKSVTSLSGAVNTLIAFFWRYWGEEDSANYEMISTAVTNNDPIAAGEGFGIFIKNLFMIDIATNETDNEFYDIVSYITA